MLMGVWLAVMAKYCVIRKTVDLLSDGVSKRKISGDFWNMTANGGMAHV